MARLIRRPSNSGTESASDQREVDSTRCFRSAWLPASSACAFARPVSFRRSSSVEGSFELVGSGYTPLARFRNAPGIGDSEGTIEAHREARVELGGPLPSAPLGRPTIASTQYLTLCSRGRCLAIAALDRPSGRPTSGTPEEAVSWRFTGERQGKNMNISLGGDAPTDCGGGPGSHRHLVPSRGSSLQNGGRPALLGQAAHRCVYR
ncbi:MAG: hypothetical protein RL136_472 [Planctomycetota bacterium]